jgi:demethylspheroidene O-methyltransferase
MLHPDFQARAIALPLFRSVARRRAADLFSLAGGFVGSQVLMASLRLGVLDALAEQPRPVPRLARDLGLPEERLRRLLQAARALRLVTRQGDDLLLGPLGTAVLGNPGARAMIEHHDALYRDLVDPAALVRGANPAAPEPPGAGQVARLWGYAGRGGGCGLDQAAVAGYSRLMARSQPLLAREVLRAVPFGRHRHLLEVGGGEGVFAAAVAERHPSLRVTLFDLPGVCDGARLRLAERGLGDRVAVRSGDFRQQALPRDADVATLVRVLHDHDDDAALALLRAVRVALPPRGRVVVAEPMAGALAAVDAYFAAYFLAMGQGRLRTPTEVTALLRRAGFARVRRRRTRMPMLVSVVVGQRPAASDDGALD